MKQEQIILYYSQNSKSKPLTDCFTLTGSSKGNLMILFE